MEILSPAGNRKSLEAALAARADAVYFGLTNLNARIGAENFHFSELKEVVGLIHAAGARAYLTLNIDISEREAGQAVRTLALAAECGVDAVLCKDPLFVDYIDLFPDMEFHFSTQAGICNSAGVEQAKAVGVKRVVLARELSEKEIKACSAVSGIETEIFIQGALCFCISGRCFLSSWGGGRSGNRGTCTSPCRVEWHSDGRGLNRPLSMNDLSLFERLPQIERCGVACLKIEGRLKGPAWVTEATELCREILENGFDSSLRERINGLGNYSGRKMTSGFFDTVYADLTAEGGRTSGREGVAAEEGGSAADCNKERALQKEAVLPQTAIRSVPCRKPTV
ncbi:MAG: peptidase U32 family protein [Planctomycetota bacterium]|jgi:putative protease